MESRLLQPKKLEPGAVPWTESCEVSGSQGWRECSRVHSALPLTGSPWLLIRCAFWGETFPLSLSLRPPGLRSERQAETSLFPTALCSFPHVTSPSVAHTKRQGRAIRVGDLMSGGCGIGCECDSDEHDEITGYRIYFILLLSQ